MEMRDVIRDQSENPVKLRLHICQETLIIKYAGPTIAGFSSLWELSMIMAPSREKDIQCVQKYHFVYFFY